MKIEIDDSVLLSVLQEASIVSKGLICDMVEAAHSGHLGTALGCSYIGAALFGVLLNFNPENPRWINRDRFILSCGHASTFLYSWLCLSGYDLSLNDLKNFRKAHSKTPGHPEFGITPGVECTTGPLGQGVANAVGLALSGEKSAQMFNTKDYTIFNNKVICLCGDGCLQEGIAAEACSLAGHWGLDNLILIYDKNNVTLDGDLNNSQHDDIFKRFESYGFDIFSVKGNDIMGFIKAYKDLSIKKDKRPKLIIVNTLIGDGIVEISGTNKAHGEAGIKFISDAKKRLGLPEQKFFISEKVKQFFKNKTIERLRECEIWQSNFEIWSNKYRSLREQLSSYFINDFSEFKYSDADAKSISTREANSQIIQKLAEKDLLMITGSADLFSSNKNHLDKYSDFSTEDYSGRNIQFGIREHAMGAIMNGICYDGIFHPSCATFLVFSDYMRTPIRIAALSHLHALYLFTHDSIAVGQDGPTHQPVETIASLRCIPNLYVVRPADREELVGAWDLYYKKSKNPFAFILSRQDLPVLDEISINDRRKGILYGAYIAKKERKILRCIVLASGSELSIALEAAKIFDDVRVISMPCMECFDEQSEKWKDLILPHFCQNRIAIEAGVSMPWYKYVGNKGKCICVENFGFSGAQTDLYIANNLTIDNLREKISMAQVGDLR